MAEIPALVVDSPTWDQLWKTALDHKYRYIVAFNVNGGLHPRYCNNEEEVRQVVEQWTAQANVEVHAIHDVQGSRTAQMANPRWLAVLV